MYNPVIKEIKKRIGYLVYPNYTAADIVYCGLQTMQAIDFLASSVQDLSNRVLPVYVMIIQAIYANCAKFYKAVQIHLRQTKTISDGYRVIYLLALKINTMANLTQFRYWLLYLYSTLDKDTSFDGLTPFRYVVR